MKLVKIARSLVALTLWAAVCGLTACAVEPESEPVEDVDTIDQAWGEACFNVGGTCGALNQGTCCGDRNPGVCYNLSNDPDNCGTCGNHCTTQCVNGNCAPK